MLCVTCWLKVSAFKLNGKVSAAQDFESVFSQPCAIESSSDDHGSPPPGSQVSSCAVSRRTSIGIGPLLRSAADDVGHISTSESHENSIVRAKQQCGAEILNFEHLKMRLDKLTGQNREKQRQPDAENGNTTVSPSPSCTSLISAANLQYVGSFPSGLNRTPSNESDVLLPGDSGIGSMRSVSSVATDNTSVVGCKYPATEQKLSLSEPPCVASSVASMQEDSLVYGQTGQQESSVSSHHQHQPVAAYHDLQLTVGNTWPLPLFCQQPGFSSEFVQPAPAYSTSWQEQLLLQLIQQQSLLIAQQMQAQHPVMTQCQQMLRLQQQLQQHQQLVQLVQSAALQSQYKPDMMQNAFVSPVAEATALSQQYTQLTSLLIESGLLPGKADEIVQQLQRIMIPTTSCPLHVPGTPLMQLLTNPCCNVDPLSQLNNHLSQSCAGSLQSLLASWSNVQVAYANVVQLLARPNPLLTAELLESMFAQLPPPLNLNALNSNTSFTSEALNTKLLELLMQIVQNPVTPMQLMPSVSVHGLNGNSTGSNDLSGPDCLNKLAGAATIQNMVPDSKQLGTPTPATCTSCTGVDSVSVANVVTQTCPFNRGPSLDLESADVPGAKVPCVPRSEMACSRTVQTGNGAKVSGGSLPKKSVDCPQDLAGLEMALKEKLRPRTTKAVAQTLPEHVKTLTSIVGSSSVVSGILSTPSQSAAGTVTCDFERSCITCGNTSNVALSALVHDVSALSKHLSTQAAKCTAAVINEKTEAVKQQQIIIVCKDGDAVAADTTALSSSKSAAAVSGNVLPDVSKDIVKPISSNMSVAASSVQLMVAAKSSSQFRECASEQCLPSAAVSLSVSSLAISDINRQHVSDSAIAATTTQLAQKHLQKKPAVTDQENVSSVGVTSRLSNPAIPVSYALYHLDFIPANSED